jgi:hypothetical protein
MPLRRTIWLAVILIALLALASCQNSSPRIPPVSEFQVQAIGTLMPGGHEEAVRPDFAPGTGGALFINQTSLTVQVAVSATLATLPIGQNFLFVLPPGSYQFYLYQPDLPPRLYSEAVADGQLRYIYLMRTAPK